MIRVSWISFSWIAAAASLASVAAGAWAVSTPIDDWHIAGPFGGTALSVAVDPKNTSTLLAGGRSSLLFQSHDFGESWLPLNLPRRNLADVTSILVDPTDSNHYLIGVLDANGGGLSNSPDGGKTWSSAKDIRDFGVRALAASPSDPSEFVAGTTRGVMRSSDAGKSWSRISDPNNLEMQGITSVAVDPKDGNIIYAGTSHLPWKSMDGGKTWESIHAGMIDDSDVFSIYVSPSQPSDIFASACSGIYASLNRGDSWRKLAGIPNTSRRTHVIRQDLLQPHTIYAGTTTGLFKSGNSGVNWRTVSGAQVNSIAFDPAEPKSMYLAMENEGMGKTSDGGETIKPINNGFVDRHIAAVTLSGDKLVAIESQLGNSTGIFFSSDRGETWKQIQDPRGLAGVHLRAVAGSSSDKKVLLASNSRQMFSSADGGQSWTPFALRMIVPPRFQTATSGAGKKDKVQAKGSAATRSSGPHKSELVLRTVTPTAIGGLYASKADGKDMVFVATSLGLFRSSDAGATWAQLDMTVFADVWGLYFPPAADGRMIARTAAGLYMSNDCGDHWTPLSFPLPAVDVNDVAIPSDPKGRLLVASTRGIYVSQDNGGKWLAYARGIGSSTVDSVLYRGSSQTAYAVEYGKLLRSNDGGSSWALVESALSSLEIRTLWTPGEDSDRMYGITSGLGILFRN